jgi:hypothetical protein
VESRSRGKRSAVTAVGPNPDPRKVIHRIPVIHRRDSQDSAGANRKARSEGCFAADERPSGNGAVPAAATSAKAAIDREEDRAHAAERAVEEEARGESRTHFSRCPGRTGAFGRGTCEGRLRGSDAAEDPGPGSQRSREISVEVRLGNQGKPKGPTWNPRDRPGPKGSGRNPSEESAHAFTGTGRNPGKVGAGGNVSPHFRFGLVRLRPPAGQRKAEAASRKTTFSTPESSRLEPSRTPPIFSTARCERTLLAPTMNRTLSTNRKAWRSISAFISAL